jgi:hypothetical protein
LREVVTVDGMRRVDRRNNFGRRASAVIWCAFMSLVLWIANFVCFITALLAYMDYNFSFDASDALAFHPIQCLLSTQATKAAFALDDIGLPHDKDKQILVGL